MFRITAFDPDASALETAAAGIVPGWVAIVVATAMLAAFVLAFLPRPYPGLEGEQFSGVDAEWEE